MGTTDANGVYFYEDTDPVSPLHTLLNLGQTSISTALSNQLAASSRIYPIANEAARAALVAKYPPSASKPLYAHRANAPVGRELEYTTDGTRWRSVKPAGGQMSGATNVFGQIAIGHGLGYTPTSINLTLEDVQGQFAGVFSNTARNGKLHIYSVGPDDIIVRLTQQGGQDFANSNVAIRWSAQ